MKKYLLIFILIFSVTFAYTAPVDPYAHLLEYNIMDKTFFEKLISEEEATYMICISEDSIKKYLNEDKINEIFLNAINNWLNKVKQRITKNGAQNKFEDVLKIINNIRLKQVSCTGFEDYYNRYEKFYEYNKEHSIALDKKADLILRFNPKLLEEEKQIASFNPYTGIISVNASYKYTSSTYIYYLSHELGHAFGLADQYSGQTYTGSFIYNSKVKRPSIMDKSKKVTCDDVDGFITSIDRTLEKEREFYSLCNDGVFIKNGQAFIKDYQTYEFKENYTAFNSKIEISYDTELPNSYIFDMTLKNFMLHQGILNLVKDMGFEVKDVNTLKNIQIKIHGLLSEPVDKTDFTKEMKTPVGLWTTVLYLKKGTKLEPKQEITRDYDDDNHTIFIDLDKNFSQTLDKDLIVPTVNFLPSKGYGVKELLRIMFLFVGDPTPYIDLLNKSSSNQSENVSQSLMRNLNNSNL